MNPNQKKLYIGNINFRTHQSSIEVLLESGGFPAKEVLIITDKTTGRSKGYGFATLEDESLLDEAVSVLNGTKLDGRALRISIATPPSEKPKSGSRINTRRTEEAYES